MDGFDRMAEALEEYYAKLTENRNRHYGCDHGDEPVRWRNPMIRYMLESVPEDSVVADWFTGDAVVPMAILFLQKQFPELRKIRRLYTIDNDEDGGYGLITRNLEDFGIDTPVTMIGNDCWLTAKEPPFGDDIGVSMLVESVGYIRRGGIEHRNRGWSDPLPEPDKDFFGRLSAFSPRIEMVQVVHGGYSPSIYVPQLEAVGYGTTITDLGNIQYKKVEALSAVKGQ